MAQWITDDHDKIDSILSKKSEQKKDLPILILEPMKLYKLLLIEDPRSIKGTEGQVVKVKNQADHKRR